MFQLRRGFLLPLQRPERPAERDRGVAGNSLAGRGQDAALVAGALPNPHDCQPCRGLCPTPCQPSAMAVVVHPNMPAVARQEGQSLGMEKRLTAEGTAIRRSGLNGESERSAGVEKQRSFLTLGLGKHWSPSQPRSRRRKRPTDRGLPRGASSAIGKEVRPATQGGIPAGVPLL
jgi:hypothetical protein